MELDCLPRLMLFSASIIENPSVLVEVPVPKLPMLGNIFVAPDEVVVVVVVGALIGGELEPVVPPIIGEALVAVLVVEDVGDTLGAGPVVDDEVVGVFTLVVKVDVVPLGGNTLGVIELDGDKPLALPV
jgi:hypothetical protein